MQPPFFSNPGFYHQPSSGTIYQPSPSSTHHNIPSSSLVVNHPPSPPPNLHHQIPQPFISPISMINAKQTAESIMMDSIKLNQYENIIYLNELSYSKDLEIHRRKISSDLEQIKLLYQDVTQLKTQIKTLNEKRREYLKSLYGNDHSVINEDEDEEDELDIETLLTENEFNVNNNMYTPHHLPKSISLPNINTLVVSSNSSNIGTVTTNVHANGTNMISNSNNHVNAHSIPTPVTPAMPTSITTTVTERTSLPPPTNLNQQPSSKPTPIPQAIAASRNIPQHTDNADNDTESVSSVITTTTNDTNNFRINKNPSKSNPVPIVAAMESTFKNNQSVNESRIDGLSTSSSIHTSSRLNTKSKNKTNIIVESKKRKEIVDIDDSDDEDSKFSLFKSPSKKIKQDKTSKDILKLIKRQEIEKQKKLHLMNRFEENEYIVIANNSSPSLPTEKIEPKIEKTETVEQSPSKSINATIVEEEIIKSPTIHQQVVNLVEEENTENSIGDDILYYSLLSGCVKKDDNLKKPIANNNISNISESSSTSSGEEEDYGKYFKSTKKKKKSKKPGTECEECREFYTACFPDDQERRDRVVRECSRHRNGHHHHTHASLPKTPTLNQSPIIVGTAAPQPATSATSTNPNQSSITKQPSVNFDTVPCTPPEYWDLGNGPTDTYKEDETQLSKSY